MTTGHQLISNKTLTPALHFYARAIVFSLSDKLDLYTKINVILGSSEALPESTAYFV